MNYIIIVIIIFYLFFKFLYPHKSPKILQIPLFRNPKGRRLLRAPSLTLRTRLWGC